MSVSALIIATRGYLSHPAAIAVDGYISIGFTPHVPDITPSSAAFEDMLYKEDDVNDVELIGAVVNFVLEDDRLV